MELSRVVAILALIVQIANMGSVFIEMLPAKYAVVIAAVVAGIQAFTRQIQNPKR